MKRLKASIGIVLFVVVLSLFAAGNTDADMQVYDADGQYLGILSDAAPMSIYMPSMELFALINYEGGLPIRSFDYESDDCTGQPYIPSSLAPILYWSIGKYWHAEKVAPISIYVRSTLYLSSVEPSPKCIPQINITLKSLVRAIEAPPPPFTLPVALPLSFEVEKRHGGRR